MSMREPDLASQLSLRIKQYTTYSNAITELGLITTALATDLTTHSKTMEEPPAALKIHHDTRTPFTNDINVLINKAKGGNLSTVQIISAINDAIGGAHPPSLIDTPFVSAVGAAASCTQGNWGGAPTAYHYAWKRNAATAIGIDSPSYTMVGADTGQQIGCIVSAVNANGTTIAPISNQIRGP